MPKTILITGATGNVGQALIRSVFEQKTAHRVVAAVRDVEKSSRLWSDLPKLEYRLFDFEQLALNPAVFDGVDTLFLLRPPHIAQVDRVFGPLIEMAVKSGVQGVVFLSVQGADKMSFIPHAKIEKLIRASSLNYCFLRPSYFMQNLTTTLDQDMQAGRIVLPAGRALFNWVDVENVGQAAAVVLDQFDAYAGQSFEITGPENLSFPEVVDTINRIGAKGVVYRSPNLLAFYRYKRRQGVARPMILVMMMLHFLPRFQPAPAISNAYERLTKRAPTSLEVFVQRYLQ